MGSVLRTFLKNVPLSSDSSLPVADVQPGGSVAAEFRFRFHVQCRKLSHGEFVQNSGFCAVACPEMKWGVVSWCGRN